MTHSGNFGEFEATIRATIRACRKEDLEALEWMGVFSRDRAIIREAFEAQERGEALMLLAVAAGFPVAQVWISFKRRNGTRLAKLWAVRTFHPLRGAGIGRHMMRAAERVLARRGIELAELEVETSNRDVLGFYRALGWRVVDMPKNESSRGPGRDDRLLLAKEIVAA